MSLLERTGDALERLTGAAVVLQGDRQLGELPVALRTVDVRSVLEAAGKAAQLDASTDFSAARQSDDDVSRSAFNCEVHRSRHVNPHLVV